MTTIGFIRHGSTAWNKEKRSQGLSNIPLDEAGLLQADKLGERIRNEKWDVVYASDLSRARATAEAIERLANLPLLLDVRLREASGGEIEGTTEQERIEKWGEDWRSLDLGIESAESVIARAMPVVDEIMEKHCGKNVLIVSHGAFTRHMLKALVPSIDLTVSPKNTSITRLVKTDAGWDCELYNCTIHLG
ncbi:histidine phosphatase family protein [Priestia taiwanensis]|uniref:Phosphatase PhoE n=1 Tax=Priestia taiwanensis TaxID=1347902 RepID=A0A917EMD6_9BACI|nr:histidine phosphatase family protein [Priestia taiwanensis]MBM7362210.1 putative phosphoglycerate mutase [Priestia taiwanensis]GGE60278.1 putative phosphatase PhoE [Priestia taiwanensis]